MPLTPVPENQTRESGLIKMVVGTLLAILGLIGLIKSPQIQNRKWRFVSFVASGLALFSGIYLFVLGWDDFVFARIGSSELGEKKAMAMVYESPEAFKASLLSTFAREGDKEWYGKVRRLRFYCSDRSKSFRVFNTVLGIYGIPESNVQCADGTYLVQYSNLK